MLSARASAGARILGPGRSAKKGLYVFLPDGFEGFPRCDGPQLSGLM